jgi:hypothetical protein
VHSRYISGLAAVALLGPVLVGWAAAVARPLATTGPAAWLALATIRRLPRRTASAVIPIAMAVGLTGALAFFNTSIAHAAARQSAQSVTASYVLGGSALSSSALDEASRLPGARAAAGVTPLNIGVTDPDLEFLGGEAVSAGSGQLSQVLDPGVTSGSLARLTPGQAAVSTAEAGTGPRRPAHPRVRGRADRGRRRRPHLRHDHGNLRGHLPPGGTPVSAYPQPAGKTRRSQLSKCDCHHTKCDRHQFCQVIRTHNRR